ncbi:hypothetical protein PHJA_000746000 [Phtheirospermum japonicum]|uniref:NAB domain-containing protein n=1 Tax=Phtheirospermum japonicum TaxID=374723 RepID=A0A830BV94_9LAMI|nr:hypothetical protein PHJA_000746000 [Phtheirospermum japonicum]
MDAKVKSMIKLIEEDADSFARRAEMYYKKRPELMKLVEEFYRAYRALSERYNHATCELRHAHRTIAKAFPDQLPFELIDDSPSRPSAHDRDPHTPDTKFPVRALSFDQDDDLLDDACGLSEPMKHEMSSENQNLDGLKKALADMEAEKESVLIKYQQCLAKLSDIETELDNAKRDSARLDEKAVRAEIEAQTLKEALIQLEVEKNAGLVKHEQYLENISKLEAMVSRVQDEAESEARALRDEISKLELENKVCLGKISILENIISGTENEASLLKKKAEKAENEVCELKKAVDDLNKEKERSAIQYKCCLEKISKLEREIFNAKDDVKRLNNDVLIGNLKLKTAEKTNLTLRTEAEDLAKKIATKDRELSEKQVELENLMACLKDEHFRQTQIEATLNSLRNSHSRSQDDQRALAVELENVVRMLKDSEANKQILEDEIRQVRAENRSLGETNLSSAVCIENMQNEILGLREIKERLEKEVSNHVDLSESLQREISNLKVEINGLNISYRAIVEQVEASGLSPKCLETNIKTLRDENSKLREINEHGANEYEILSKKLENAQELLSKNVVSQNSVSGEKTALVAEKASLLSQLETITETMHKLLEKNAVLENSLSTAKVELEGLREKSKGLEEICELLKNERSFLLTERSTLASKLENVERRLKTMEKRYNGLEKKYADLENEKNNVNCQVEELKVSLSVEKQERTSSKLQSETKLAGLKNKIHSLQEENSRKKKEFEEELERSLKAQFEISILQKFMKDMEEKNSSLVIECQKHVEASKLAEKLISELESESLEQQVESELLLDEIERLRLCVYQIFRSLESGPGPDFEDNKIENERTFVNCILENIEGLKCSVSKHEDDKQLLLVENSVLFTLLEQLESKGLEIESQKAFLENEFKKVSEKLETAMNEKDELLETNGKLKSDVNVNNRNAEMLEAEMENLRNKQVDLRKHYDRLEEVYTQVNRDNKNLLKNFTDLKEEKCLLDENNDAAIIEYLATSNESEVLRRFSEEKVNELKLLLGDLTRQQKVNSRLEREMNVLVEKLAVQQAENLLLKDCVDKIEREMQGMRDYNVRMKKDIVSVKESLLQTEEKLLESEVKLEAAENLNLKLCKTVDELENDFQDSVRINENLEMKESIQKMEIESLCMVKTDLESKLNQLRGKIEEKLIREQILSSELQLWEAEASTFYFDLQISAVDGILFKNKLQELACVYRVLENENASKTTEIEEMKGRIFSMEREISGLKSRICAYDPVVAALRDDITLLEHNALLHKKLKSSRYQESEFSEAASSDPSRSSSETLPEDHSLVSLQDLHTRIKAVGKLMEETNKPRRSTSKRHKEDRSTSGEVEKPVRCLGRDKPKPSDTPKIQKIKTKPSETRNGSSSMLMKDIPLDRVSSSNRKRGSNNNSRADDQMLELWENAESGKRDLTIGESLRLSYKMTDKDIVYDPFDNVIKRSSDPPSTDSDMEKELKVDFLPSRKSTENERRVLDRLASDAAKLENLQTTAKILREKMEETGKKKSNKKVDYETVWEQLLEAEETVEYLVDLNGQLVRNVESCPSPDRKSSPKLKEAVRVRRRKVSEQARKGSERIGRLQLELQKIQYVLVKMEEEAERKSKGKGMFFRSKSVVLRDFIYNGRRNSGKRKKGPLCGCFRATSSRDGRSS